VNYLFLDLSLIAFSDAQEVDEAYNGLAIPVDLAVRSGNK
jgi:hypothetical protein